MTMEKVYLTAFVLILVTGAIGQFMPLLRKHRKTLEGGEKVATQLGTVH